MKLDPSATTAMMRARENGRQAVQRSSDPVFTGSAQMQSERYQNAALRHKPVQPVCLPRRLMADAGPEELVGQGRLRQKLNCQERAPQRPAEELSALNSEAF